MKNLEKMKLINLTQHDIVVYDQSNNEVLRVPPSGVVARVQSTEELVGYMNGIPLFRALYGEVQGLPEPQENTVYIVSQLVLQALKEKGIQRTDVMAPNTNPGPNGAVRDQQGRIVGVRSFIVL
jgi:hypothetical protein